MCDTNGIPFPDKRLALTIFGSGGGAAIAGIAVRYISKEFDIVILEASKEASIISPIMFSKPDIIEIGAAVASIGFPIPPRPDPSTKSYRPSCKKQTFWILFKPIKERGGAGNY